MSFGAVPGVVRNLGDVLRILGTVLRDAEREERWIFLAGFIAPLAVLAWPLNPYDNRWMAVSFILYMVVLWPIMKRDNALLGAYVLGIALAASILSPLLVLGGIVLLGAPIFNYPWIASIAKSTAIAVGAGLAYVVVGVYLYITSRRYVQRIVGMLEGGFGKGSTKGVSE